MLAKVRRCWTAYTSLKGCWGRKRLRNAELEKGDFVLCKIKTENAQNNFLHYVGKVLKVESEESIEIQFYRQSKMTGRFVLPQLEDISAVGKEEIMTCLPKPSTTGGIKHVASMLQLPIDLTAYHCQWLSMHKSICSVLKEENSPVFHKDKWYFTSENYLLLFQFQIAIIDAIYFVFLFE